MSGDLCFSTAHELRSRLRQGDITAAAVTESCLARIAAVDGEIGAFVEVWGESAREQAGRIDEKLRAGHDPGPLAGIPVALKDNLCTRQGTTTCASRILKSFRSPYDATVVKRLHDAGAVFLGRLNMDEFAMGSSCENSSVQATRNPWDRSRVPGGSSGGSAAAVAANETIFSLGSDTGGSIRTPASFCGCVGLKPTYGRVSRYGLVAFASSLDQIGPLTKDVRDCALALGVISGHDPFDSTSADAAVPDFESVLDAADRSLSIGVPAEYFSDALDGEVRDAVESALEQLQGEGVHVREIQMPHTEYGIAAYYIIANAEASANLARYDGVRYGMRHPDAKSLDEMYTKTRSDGFGMEVKRRIMLGTYVLSSGYYDAYYLKAQKVRALIKQDFDHAFEQCDLLIAPTAPTPAFAIGEKVEDPLQMYLSDVYTITANLAGLPALSIPCGHSASGLPIGLQFIGKPFEESTLLRVGHRYEQLRGAMHEPVMG